MQIILETPRLYLREFTATDAPLLLALNKDPEVLKYVHELPLQTIEDAEKILINNILPQYSIYKLGRLAVHLKENDEFIGWCGLKYRPELDEIDLGYRFFPLTWGKGYATESAQHTLNYGLEVLQLQRIVGRAHVENIASLKVLQKIGMKYLCNEIVDNCPVETYESINSKS